MERRLIEEYRQLITALLPHLHRDNLVLATKIAAAATEIGGYGPVKDASVVRYRDQLRQLQAEFDAAPRQSAALLKLKNL